MKVGKKGDKMTYAEKRLIKEKSLKKIFRQKVEKAKYDFFKEIQERGGIFENAGQRQELELKDFIEGLYILDLPYSIINQLKKEVNSLVYDFFYNFSESDKRQMISFIKNYEKKNALKVA